MYQCFWTGDGLITRLTAYLHGTTVKNGGVRALRGGRTRDGSVARPKSYAPRPL